MEKSIAKLEQLCLVDLLELMLLEQIKQWHESQGHTFHKVWSAVLCSCGTSPPAIIVSETPIELTTMVENVVDIGERMSKRISDVQDLLAQRLPPLWIFYIKITGNYHLDVDDPADLRVVRDNRLQPIAAEGRIPSSAPVLVRVLRSF